MTNRLVRQIFPRQEGESIPPQRPFADFLGHRNLILLGDPGSGKSFLFDHFSKAENGRLYTARAFLNVPSIPNHSCLYIDGLDEKRASRGDQNTIDEIVRKLFALAPARVRLSCRAQDWLGGTDYEGFKPYFETDEGAIVLHLENLSPEEQIAVLNSVEDPDPQSFLEEAHARGLEDLLFNAQNLILLSRVVRSGSWPNSRRELFEVATRLLLSEQNRVRSSFGPGIYSVEELLDPAGIVCATRLISDVGGISLAENSDHSEFPSYRSIALNKPELIRATLGRRVFRASAVDETVDYSHRTTAEYLASAWLAKAVRNGLPLGRLRALIGVDGQPATELRGIHAWLAVLLREHAEEFIEADPYGVLAYGDAASLSLPLRQRLLQALAQLAEDDPWFRGESFGLAAAGSLCKADMTEAFEKTLRSSRNFHLRSLVLEIIASGSPDPDLHLALANITSNPSAPYAERILAARALTKMGPKERANLNAACRGQLRKDDAAIRLRAQLYSSGAEQDVDDICNLLNDALLSKVSLPIGAIWNIADKPSSTHLLNILDSFKPTKQTESANESGSDRTRKLRNAREVLYTYDRILLRALDECAPQVEAPRIVHWLRTRYAISQSARSGKFEELKQALQSSPVLLRQIYQLLLDEIASDDSPWVEMHQARELLLHAVTSREELEWTVDKLRTDDLSLKEREFLYDLSLLFALQQRIVRLRLSGCCSAWPIIRRTC